MGPWGTLWDPRGPWGTLGDPWGPWGTLRDSEGLFLSNISSFLIKTSKDFLISNLRISVRHAKSGKGFLWSHLVPNLVGPCTRPWHTLYQTLSQLVRGVVTPCTRPWHTLYQTLSHLVPNSVTPKNSFFLSVIKIGPLQNMAL